MAKKSTEIKSLDINIVEEGTHRDCVSAILCEDVFDTNLKRDTWFSGSFEVYPIMFWKNEVIFQMQNHEPIDEYKAAAERVVKEHPDLFSDGYVSNYDGSCPVSVTFKYTDETKSKLKSSKR